MIETLKQILEYLNKVPNRKYGDNYLLALELTKIISNLEENNQKKLEIIKEVRSVLKTLKTDAKWALTDKWEVDWQTSSSMKGFECQIELIDNILPKLKLLK